MAYQFSRAVLPNGLTVIGEVDPEAHTSAIGFFVKAGARDEPPALMGVSHFLEHMMFKGSETRSPADVDRDFDAIGADHNAFTTTEMTAFWAHNLPEHLPAATEILADILRPALRQDDFDDEKKVIIEEIAMYEDQPFWVLYERTMETYYGAFPLSHRVLGTRETITSLRRDQMLDYFMNRYSADNTTVALAGRVDFDAMCGRLETLCGGWQTTRATREHPPAAPAHDTLAMTSDSVNRLYAIIASPAPAYDDDRRYAAAILAQILGGADGSRLYWSLIETGIAEEARVQYDGHDGVGDYLAWWVASPQDHERILEIVDLETARLPETLTEDDLVRVRSRVQTSATLQGELPAGRMQRLGRQWTYMGRYRSLEEELDLIASVTLDDLRAVYAAYPFKPRVIATLAPAK